MYQEWQVQRTWGRNAGGGYLRTSEETGRAAAELAEGRALEDGVKGVEVVQTLQGLSGLCKNFGFYSFGFCQNAPKSPWNWFPMLVLPGSELRQPSRVKGVFTGEGLER